MRIRRPSSTRGAISALSFLLVLSAGPSLAVDSADDVCGAATNPCVITSAVKVDDGAVLDFGTRELRIQGGGQIDTGAGTVTIKCGKFSLETGTSLGLKIRGPSGFGTTDGGNLLVEAVRSCSAKQATWCVKDSECDFGTCSSQVCALDPDRLCANDGACDLGNCGATVCQRDFDRLCSDDPGCDIGPCNLTTRRCSKDTTVVCFSNTQCNFGPCAIGDPRCGEDLATGCSTNSDCDLGSCAIDVCTKKEKGAYRQCSQDSQCFDGTCSIGDGSVRLNGKSRADGAEPGSMSFRAAGNIDVLQTVNVSSTNAQSDGGFFELESGAGSIVFGADLQATGGGQSQGGEVCMIANDNISINGQINVNGGDFDGGFIEFIAGQDLNINAGLEASSTAGGGLGGEIDASADRDLNIALASTIATNGHMSADNFGGDGGPQSYFAGRNMSIGSAVVFTADGSLPDGFGEDVFFESEVDMTIAGSVSARGRGNQGSGGTISTDSGGTFNATATSKFDVTGGNSGGGAVEFFSVGSITFGGLIDGQASNGGTPDSVLVFSDTDVTATGDVLLNGGPSGSARGDIEIEACRVNLNAGALLSNLGGDGTTTLVGHERINVNTGSSVVNATNGTNLLRYRSEDKPPTINGTVTPAFESEIVPSLSGCPICGNSEIEGGETCDDGNKNDGDGCSSTCQDEGCIAQTPGYPNVPLCDDGQECTVDTCNSVTHSCEQELSCEDGNECTVDTCVNNACVHVKDNGLCDDDNPCTLDICGSFGCTYGLSNGACDDGLSCTVSDVCSGGECNGTDTCPSGESCSSTSGICEDDSGGCGDPTADGRTTASDALFVLNVAVGLQNCATCTCDVDNSTSVSASDALRVLNFAVGISGVTLDCPAC